MMLALALAASAMVPQVDAVARRSDFAGEILIARGDAVLFDKAYGTVDPAGRKGHRVGARWRLASITKQVVATLVMADVAASRLTLDAPVAPLLAEPGLGNVTVRQLLTHHSGLPNPDTTPAAAGGMPDFYLRAAPDYAFCKTAAAPAGGAFFYNNCDYIVLGRLLDRVGTRPWTARLTPGLAVAQGRERLVPGFVAGKPEPAFVLASFGAAGALTGSAGDLLRFDRALLDGKLLPADARAMLWQGDPAAGYAALGQWVFPGKLKGCAGPKRIVQRDGEIGGVQTRNYLLPDDDISIIVLTNRSSDDFAIGEIWQQSGFAYDLLSAAVCAA